MIVSTYPALRARRISWLARVRQNLLMPLVLMLSVLLGGWPVAVAAAEEFLEPDQAFKLGARSPDGASIELRYEIAPGYYLYRERFAVEAAPVGVKLGEAVYPPGKIKFDETFQKDVESYRNTVLVTVPVVASPAQFKLTVTSQGCADAGLCYPPRQQVLKVQVDGGAVRQVELMADEAGLAWQPAASEPLTITARRVAASPATAAPDSATAALQSGSLWTIAGVFLLAGVLLSFTPCVLPMVPILSSIIVGQGEPVSRWRGLGLSVSYALGMALVYTLFGVAAGLAGEGLAAALQNPWVLGAFALLLVGLSLSMFGYYELALPNALQSRLAQVSSGFKGGHHLGVFAMGGISALIVGPCVAAPLAGALVYISQTRDVLLGAVALFAMACGMSLPLLLVGVSAGSLLPHSGAWMESVKRFFGVLLIAVALWMVTPVLPVWLMMAAWGSLMLVSASYLGLLEPLPPTARRSAHLGKGLALVLAIGGAAQWLGMLSGGRSILQPLSHLVSSVSVDARGAALADGRGQASPAQAGAVQFQRVKSVAELDALLLTAGKPVMLDFYADWCVSCKEFEQFTFRDPQVQAKLAGAVLVQADVTANDADDRALLKRFQLFGPPGIIFFDPQGQEQAGARVIGYQNAQQFLRSLQTAGL